MKEKSPELKLYKNVLRKKTTQRSVFVITYDPRLPSISAIQAKNWRTMASKDSYMAEVFKKTSLTAYRRQPNLRNWLIRAKVPNGTNLKRKLKGMTKCGRGCSMIAILSIWYMLSYARRKDVQRSI